MDVVSSFRGRNKENSAYPDGVVSDHLFFLVVVNWKCDVVPLGGRG